MGLRHLLAGALLAPVLHGQSSTRVVHGAVFDSLAGTPLAGAVVQVILVDSGLSKAPVGSAVRVFFGTTDANGRYRIAGLPGGHFAIGFQHDALSGLGLDSPIRAFALDGDSSVSVQLAIPAAASVRAQLCGPAVRLEGEGVIAGYVLDAKQGSLLAGAVVRASWLELVLERARYRTVQRTVTAIVGDDGRYQACGLTSDDAVALHVVMPGFRAITHRIAMPTGGALRQDFRLADSSARVGTASLTGRVLLADGSAPRSGQVVIDALALDVGLDSGAFSLTGIPPGSWRVEARVLGYEPQAMLVDVPAQGVGTTRIVLAERAQLLDAVRVLGRRGGEEKILNAIALRRRTSVGSVFLRGDEWLESALEPADVVRGAAGFRYVSPDVVLASGCGFKHPPSDEPRQVPGPPSVRTRTLAVYLNGLRVVGGLGELKTAVTMRDVLAVEAYQDVANAPTEWRAFDVCAILAVWTKR